jgi:hypothetical protein
VREPALVTDEAMEGMPVKSPPSMIPKKYQSSATSDLIFNVEAVEANTFPIEMKSK